MKTVQDGYMRSFEKDFSDRSSTHLGHKYVVSRRRLLGNPVVFSANDRMFWGTPFWGNPLLGNPQTIFRGPTTLCEDERESPAQRAPQWSPFGKPVGQFPRAWTSAVSPFTGQMDAVETEACMTCKLGR